MSIFKRIVYLNSRMNSAYLVGLDVSEMSVMLAKTHTYRDKYTLVIFTPPPPPPPPPLLRSLTSQSPHH